MSNVKTSTPDAPLDENKEPSINTIEFKKVPNNTFTMILKAHGKVYALGGEIGKIEDDTPDEDLDSTLRALQGAALTVQRTLAVRIGGREETYPLPGESNNIEENLAPKVDEEIPVVFYVAGTKIEQGQVVHLQTDGKLYPLSSADPEPTPEP